MTNNPLETEHLRNAPIREALVDIQIVPPTTFSHTVMDDISNQIRDDFPEHQEINTGQIDLNFQGAGTQPQTDFKSFAEGRRFLSSDKKYVVQFRRNGFTFSRLEPYQDWATMRDKAMELWAVYQQHIHAETISRVAARYINVLSFDLPADIGDYFYEFPEIPNTLEDRQLNIDNFLYRMSVSDEQRNAQAIITQAFQGLNANSSRAEIILDIDTICQKQRSYDDPDLWNNFELLRGLKNDIFFGFITEKTRALYR